MLLELTLEPEQNEKYSSKTERKLQKWSSLFLRKFLSSKLVISFTHEKLSLLASNRLIMEKYVGCDKLSPYYDMAAVLSDLHHKDNSHYNTGRLEVREYTGEFQY